MRRPARFAVRSLPVMRSDWTSPAAPSQAHVQLLQLLRSLIGHEVSLQAGGMAHRGRLISVEPLILQKGDGEVSFVRPDLIVSVDF